MCSECCNRKEEDVIKMWLGFWWSESEGISFSPPIEWDMASDCGVCFIAWVPSDNLRMVLPVYISLRGGR